MGMPRPTASGLALYSKDNRTPTAPTHSGQGRRATGVPAPSQRQAEGQREMSLSNSSSEL